MKAPHPSVKNEANPTTSSLAPIVSGSTAIKLVTEFYNMVDLKGKHMESHITLNIQVTNSKIFWNIFTMLRFSSKSMQVSSLTLRSRLILPSSNIDKQ